MAAVSPTLSVKSTSCFYSRSNQNLQCSETLTSTCSLKSTLKFQSLCLSSSFLSSSNQIIKLKSVVPRLMQPTRSKGGLVIKMMSVEAGIGVMGTKLGMMSYFEENGTVVPVTVIGFKEGNIVTQVKTESTDGYSAVQVGYERVRDRKLSKPELGHLGKAGVIPMRHLQEFRLVSADGFTPSQKILFEDLFKEGELVDISGTTIGKGFQAGSLFKSRRQK